MTESYREELTITTKTGEELSLTLRQLDREEYGQGEEIQRVTWGADFNEMVPQSLMMINQRLGGVVAGAFDGEGSLLAFVFGQTGLHEGHLSHWSHMMAVRPGLRSLGLGRHLKLFQRRYLLDGGVEEAEWTYDPLESRNAHLNLSRLGAEPVEYERDVYGDGSTSELHEGIGTDRFVVRWALADREVEARIAGRGGPPSAVEKDAPIVNADAAGAPREVPFELPDSPRLRLEIPVDIQAVKTDSMAVAKRWRASTRFAFEAYFERGYRIPRFLHDPRSRRSFYVLIGK